ncbi:MAG: RdgB/HAM1 family non-canonical purine NTP pyrophosphatase [Bacteroidales bacterium]
MGIKLVFATNNEHKLREIKHMLGSGYEVAGLRETGINGEIPEPYPTLEENALAKARYVHKRTGLNCFADDTGLEIIALGGAPGVFSARFAAEEGPFPNQESSYRANMKKVLRLMEGIPRREARFRTVIALIMDGKEYFFEGQIKGTILDKPRGEGGFGYDPIFMPEGRSRSFAEMNLEEKNRISHRGEAFRKLQEFLTS